MIHSKTLFFGTLSISYGFLSLVSIINMILYVSRKEIIYLYSFITTTIASLFYFYFYKKQTIPIQYRYMDWILTTPILLLELCLLSNIKNPKIISIVLGVNFLTFAFGWIGEKKCIHPYMSCFLAFIPFIITFYFIIHYGDWNHFIPFFITIWTLYGFVYLFNKKYIKNSLYNILDLLSKGVFSLLLI